MTKSIHYTINLGKPKSRDASPTNEKFRKICEDLRALKQEIDEMSPTVDMTAMEDIKRLLKAGPAVCSRTPADYGEESAIDEESIKDHEDAKSTSQNDAVDDTLEEEDMKGASLDDILSALGSGLVAKRSAFSKEAPVWLLLAPPSDRYQGSSVLIQTWNKRSDAVIVSDELDAEKLLSSMTAMKGMWHASEGSIVIVRTASRTRKWMLEVERYLGETTMSTLLLNRDSVSAFDLHKYKVIVTSYNYVTAEATKLSDFTTAIGNYRTGRSNVPPKRPHVALLSGVWEMDGVNRIGRYLVLDEVQLIKKFSGQTFEALQRLRTRFATVIGISSTLHEDVDIAA